VVLVGNTPDLAPLGRFEQDLQSLTHEDEYVVLVLMRQAALTSVRLLASPSASGYR